MCLWVTFLRPEQGLYFVVWNFIKLDRDIDLNDFVHEQVEYCFAETRTVFDYGEDIMYVGLLNTDVSRMVRKLG